MTDLIEELKKAIVDGDEDLTSVIVTRCIEAGLLPGEVLEKAVVAGIEEVGRLWQENEYFLPDVILSAEAFKLAVRDLNPLLEGGPNTGPGKAMIGTIAGDMHDLGKSIVGAMLSGAGFEVIDLGVDVAVETFIEKTRELQPKLVGIGAYMTTTMILMKDVIVGLEREGLRDKVKVMIGGVPTSEEFAQEIGADFWGKDAMDTVAKARAL